MMRRANIVNVAGRDRIWRLLAMAVLIVSALALSGGDSRAQSPLADNITVTDTTISYTWEPATRARAVLFYFHEQPTGKIRYHSDSAVKFNGNSFTVSGLSPNTTYRFLFYQRFFGELIVKTLPAGLSQQSEISISAGADITEGGNATFTLTADPAPAASLDVNVSPLQSGDWGISTAKQTVTIPTTGSATLTLATTNDAIDEADGSVTATIISGTGYTASTSNGSATVQVSDDDVPELTIAAGPDVTEANDATFTITASPAPHAPLSVTVAITESGGFASPGAQTITIPTSGTTTLTVATIGDTLDEPDGTVTATLAAGTGYTLASSSTATVIVTDDDDPEVSITAGGDITEGGSASFSLSVTPTQAAAIDVTVTVSQSGDFASVGQQTVTIPASGSATFSVVTTDDSADESDGSITATIDPGTGYAISASAGAATVNVADDDDPPPHAALITNVKQWRNDPCCSSDSDHTDRWDRVLFALGEPISDSSLTKMTSTEAQTYVDKGWNRWVDVVTALKDVEATSTSSTNSVADPEISISAGSAITEGGNAIFTLTASPAPSASVDVSVEVTQSGDYTSQTGTQTVTISDTGTASLVIGTTDDATDESDGSVTTTINTGTGYTVSSTAGAATINVADDDVTQQQTNTQPTITIADASADEGDTITFTVSVSPAHTAAITLDYETKDRSAVSHPDVNDYTAASGSITIPANSGSATITVTTIEDTDIEIDDEFKVVLSGTLPTGVVMGNDTATGTITNDDEGSRGKERYVRINAQPTAHQYIRLDSNPSLHHMFEGPVCIGTCPETRHLRLDSQPYTTVTLKLYITNAALRRHFSVTPEYLTFTTTNWNVHQTVTLSYKLDFNKVSEVIGLRMRSVEDPGATVLNSAVWVYVFDMLRLSTASGIPPKPNLVTEGDSSSSVVYKLKLDAMPYEEIPVTITNPDPGAVTVSPMSATFDHTNWSEYQEFTITAVDDSDANDERVRITATIEQPGSTVDITKEFWVEVEEPPTPSVRATPLELHVTEGGSSTYEVWPRTDPGDGNTVTVTPTFTGTDVTVQPTSLTFTGGTNGDWQTRQTVTVTAPTDTDATDTLGSQLVVSHVISGDSPDYTATTPSSTVAVGVLDAEAKVEIEFDRDNNLILNEGDTAGVPIRVRLTNDPADAGGANKQVVLQTHPTSTDLVASPTTLTFTTGPAGNWNEWQTLTIVPGAGKVDDGNTVHDRHWVKVSLGMAPHQVTHLPGYPDTHYDAIGRPIDILYFDDELADDLILEHSTLSINEDGDPVKYKLTLGSDPGEPVTVTIANPDSTKLTISPATVTFGYGGAEDWHIEEITITPVADTDSDDETLQLVHTYNYDGTTGKTQSLTVNIKDTTPVLQADALEPLTLVYSTDSIHIDEYWSTDLSGKTEAEIEEVEAGAIDLGVDRSLNPSQRTDYPQFCVKLNRDPGVNVRVQMPYASFRSELGKSPRYWFQYEPSEYVQDDYTFTPGDSGTWNTDACFIADSIAHRDQYNIDIDLSPTVASTANVEVPTFRFRISDNYWNHVDVTVPGGAPINVTEGGAVFTYNVQMSQTSSDRYASPAKLTITVPEKHRDAIRVWPSEITMTQKGSYGEVHKIRVLALPDNDLDDERIVLTHTVSSMAGGAKKGDAPVTQAMPYKVAVHVTDVESMPIAMEVGPSGLFLVEESFSDNILVRLQSDPINTVTVTASVPKADRGKVRILPDKLTFDSSNYNTFQRFSVEALSDADKSNDKVTVTISATGTGLIIPDVTIDADIIDDD